MTKRTELLPVRYRNTSWLTRTHYPRPHAAHETQVDYLIPLYEHEIGLDKGRFNQHQIDGGFEYMSSVDLSLLSDTEERCLRLEIMVEWVANQGCVWSLVPSNDSPMILEFWFDEGYCAAMFEFTFGGRAEPSIGEFTH